MKYRFKKLLLVFIPLFTMISCSKEEDETPKTVTLNLSETEIVFMAQDDRKGFNILSNSEWKITSQDDSWYSISETAGEGNKEIFVEPQANDSNNSRSSVFTVNAGSKSIEVKIVQNGVQNGDNKFLQRAEITLDNVFENMWNSTEDVMYDKYPNEMKGRSSALLSKLSYDRGFTFLWGFSSVFSGYNALTHSTKNEGGYKDYYDAYGAELFKGLSVYDNSDKSPRGYAAFGNSHDDRYYDDNVWVGIDLLELYEHTPEDWSLQKARIVWTFIMSGRDEVLGDGIYWKEGDFTSKNTCSNAPVVVMGVKLYQATGAEQYLKTAKELYSWTKENLQDPSDLLYWDNIHTADGYIEEQKYHYNSGQMMQAAVLLYNETGEQQYLTDAQDLAEACYNGFFENFTNPEGEQFKIVKDRDIWFSAIMFRGFIELYHVDNNSVYIDAYEKSLDNAWTHSRDPQSGLLIKSFKGASENTVKTEEKNILVQGGFIEMFARMHNVKNGIE